MSSEEKRGKGIEAEQALEAPRPATSGQGGPAEARPSAESDMGEADSLDRMLRQAADYLNKGLLPEAKAQASKAITARPANALAQNLMAMTLFHQGRLSRAQEIFESLVRRNPEVLTLHINAGLAALHQDDLPCALAHFRETVDLDSSCARAFGYLALVHLKLGELDLARAALQEAGLTAQAARFEEAADPQAVARLGCELEQELERLMCSDSFLGKPPAPHEGFADVAQFSVYQPLPGGEEAFIQQMNDLAEEQSNGEEQSDRQALLDSPDPLDSSDLNASIDPPGAPEQRDLSASTEEPAPPEAPVEQAHPAPPPTVTGPHLPADLPADYPGPALPDTAPQMEDLEHVMEAAFINEISSFTERRQTGSHPVLPQGGGGDTEIPTVAEILDGPLEEGQKASPWVETSRTEKLYPETTTRRPLTTTHEVQLLTERLDQLSIPLVEAGHHMERHGPLLLLRPGQSADGMLIRQTQMILQQGRLTWSQAHRVSKGADAGLLQDQAGELTRVQGQGLVALYPGADHQYELVRLEDDALFVPQPCLAGCSAQLRWENGHIPGLRDRGPDIMHLRGQGVLALRCRGPLWSCAVTDDAPLRVNIGWVLGWTEAVVPQVLHHHDEAQMVGFEGEGVVWLTAGETCGP